MIQHKPLELAYNAAIEWLEGINQRPVNATKNLCELREDIDITLAQKGRSAEEVINHILKATEDGFHGSVSGRFFAWVIGGGLPSALAADWLVSTWDQNAALYACGPAASVVEEVAGEWIKELLYLPKEASVAFTTGCQFAHFTCLAAARVSVLRQAGWDVNQDGLFGAPPIRVLTSEHRHGSVDRAVRYLGLGNRSLHAIQTDAKGQIPLDNLEDALKASDQPTILVLDAADLNIAAFDPFYKLIPLAKKHNAWVHIDGAFGLFARASDTFRHLTDGIELADSWATDGHKWLNVPFDCGIGIIRHRDVHRESMTISASYIATESAARDQIDWNPEWSRRARGIPVYAALMELGKEGVEDLINRCCRYCHTLVTEIGKLPTAEMLWEPQLNQGLVRFLDDKQGATEADHDKRTDAVISAINDSGEAFFSSTTWQGKTAMRVSVVNWRTSDDDVARTIAAVQSVLASNVSS